MVDTVTPTTMDINCDLGESFGNWQMGSDTEIMSAITTANVACGFHAGDPVNVLRTVELALASDVAVGAHPGLPDLLGFGRRRMDVSPEDVYAYVVYQVGAVREALRLHGATLHHVKPHGAFLVVLRDDPAAGEAAAKAIFDADEDVLVYWPAPTAESPFANKARELGLRVVGEVYPDLDYDDEGQLVLERRKKHTGASEAVERLRHFLDGGTVRSVNGVKVALDAESICVHGDGPDAVDVANALRGEVERRGIAVGAVPREDRP